MSIPLADGSVSARGSEDARAAPACASAAPQRAGVAARARMLAPPLVLSEAMKRLYQVASRVARTNLPVLVVGETGTGKELLVRAIHQLSPRASAPFCTLDCASIPESLLESVLFGYERGAFTGAEQQTPGLFERAHGGSLFLDEVSELSLRAQAALLRALELGRIVRVGGTREIAVDVRVLAATHRDLTERIEHGCFREDLLFRLDALSLSVPPLRERREEIAPLAERFLQGASARWGTKPRPLSDEVLELLTSYSWPGNIRQLSNVVERAVTVAAGEQIEVYDLPEPLRSARAGGSEPAVDSAEQSELSLSQRVRKFERELIMEALRASSGNQTLAARLLGIPRRTLANKVHAYDLRRESTRD